MSKILRHVLKIDLNNTTENRTAVGKKAGIVGLCCNLLVVAIKLVIGGITGAVSIMADAMNNLSDAVSSVTMLVGFKLSEKPADRDHPFGHARFEYLSGLFVSVLIMVIGVEFAITSVKKIITPRQTQYTVTLLGVLALTILIKLWMARFYSAIAKVIKSEALEATALDSRNDCITTGLVLTAAIISKLFSIEIDGWAGLVVAVYILISGARMVRDTINPLIGEAIDPKLEKEIKELLLANGDVIGVHDLIIHDYGPGQKYASAHVEMDASRDPIHSHAIVDNLEKKCLDQYGVHMVIHYDHIDGDDHEAQMLKGNIDSYARSIDARLSIHDFRIERENGACNINFDIRMPYELKKEENELTDIISSQLSKLCDCPVNLTINFDYI